MEIKDYNDGSGWVLIPSTTDEYKNIEYLVEALREKWAKPVDCWGIVTPPRQDNARLKKLPFWEDTCR